jgi:hypothetical protein
MTEEELRIKNALEASGLFSTIAKIELYQRVILAFDLDIDYRLKKVVDLVLEDFRKDLMVVHESEGAVTMIWKQNIPEAFLKDKWVAIDSDSGNRDFWQIIHSVTSKSITENYFKLGQYFPHN